LADRALQLNHSDFAHEWYTGYPDFFSDLFDLRVSSAVLDTMPNVSSGGRRLSASPPSQDGQ
jgi:hypothetical protein